MACGSAGTGSACTNLSADLKGIYSIDKRHLHGTVNSSELDGRLSPSERQARDSLQLKAREAIAACAQHLPVAERDHLPCARRDSRAACLAQHLAIGVSHNPAASGFDQLHGLERAFVPRPLKLDEQVPDSLDVSGRSRLGKVSEGNSFDPWITHGEKGSLIAPTDGLECQTHRLHVLLRHRLLLEAEVGEGAFAVEVDDEPHDLAIADVEQRGDLRLDLPDVEPARLRAPGAVDLHEHAPVVEFTELLRRKAGALPGTPSNAPGLRHLNQPVGASGIGAV